MKNKTDSYKDVSRDKLIHELGRYKKAVHTRDIMIEGMKNELLGQEEIRQLLYGLIYVLVGENERTLKRKEISEAFGKYTVEIKSGEDDEFKIKVVKSEKKE